MKGEIQRNEDGTVTLTLHLSEEEARELDSPLDDEIPVHPSLFGAGQDYCAVCTDGFHRGRSHSVRARSRVGAAMQAFTLCNGAFSLREGRCGPG